MSGHYHPPEIITNNASPVLSADLAYEAHGKCGITRVLNADDANDNNVFNAYDEGVQNAWKVVFLQETTVVYFRANNISNGFPIAAQNDCQKLGHSGGVTYAAGIEIMADITNLQLYVDEVRPEGLCILYIDCTQS